MTPVHAQVTEDSYVQLVAAANANRDDGTVDARSMDAALAALSTSDDGAEDRHPERCARRGVHIANYP